MRSAARIVSGSCSTTTSVFPKSRKPFSISINRFVSRGCRQIDGSSSTYSAPTRCDPNDVASWMRCAARKCRSQPVERQVIQSYFIEEAQPLLNFDQNLIRNLRLRRAQRERVEEGARVFHRHLANFGDRPPLDFHGARLSAQPRPLAIRTRRVTAIAAQKHANVQLVFLALEPAKESFDAGEILLRVALENRVALRRR